MAFAQDLKEAEITERDSLLQEDVTWCDKWRKNNSLNPIKNQGTCNCCYAFALCGVIEVLYFIEKKERIQLSVQDIYNHLIRNESKIKMDVLYAVLLILFLKKDVC
ncbi:unnamed protein product [Lathyrus oleraceus]